MKVVSIFGELSGKLGGIVAARNNAGAYFRSFTNPINPNTIAQLRARNKFGAASNSYHSLSPALKSAWGGFANTVFAPKNGTPGVSYSGFNAFVSLRSGVENGQSINQTFDITVNGAAPLVAATFNPFSFSTTPPVFTVEGAIKEQVTGAALTLSVDTASASSSGSFSFGVLVGGGLTGGSDIENFVDANDNGLGFAVYMSNPNPQAGMFFDNPEKYCLGYLEQPQLDAGDRSSVERLDFASTSNVFAGDYQDFPIANDVVLISVYVVSVTGMFKKIGSEEVTLT